VESYKEILKSIEQAELHFEEGAIREGQKLVSRIRHSFNNLEKIPNKLRHKFNFIHAQSKYFDDVSSYAANPKREELIEEAKDLVTNKGDLAPRKRANKIHALQGKWQLLDQSSKSASRSQWESFKQLIDKAWEPCAEFFEELNEVKKNNARNRLKLIEEINQFAAKSNNKDSIQYLSRFLKNAFTKWQNYSPVSDNDFKTLKQEFSKARKPIFDLIRSIEETNKQQKENLIEEVKNFVAEDSNTGITFFKDIKQKFKAIGPAGFKAEKVLWDEFHKAGDKFFEEEKAIQKEQINLMSEVLSALKADESSSIEDAAKALSESSNARKSKEYMDLKKALESIKSDEKAKIISDSIEMLKSLLPYDGNANLKDLKVDNSIAQAILTTSYPGNTDTLKKLVVEIEMLIGKEQSKTEEAYKQQIMLEKLQSKFNSGASEKDRPTAILVEFINNSSEKKTATQTKLWQRCCDAYLQTLNRSR
jgi:exonuclease SbcC